MPDSAMRKFGQWVTHYLWTEVLQVEDVPTKWHNFVTTTSEAFNRYFPAKRVTVHPPDAPWMTPHIKRLIRQRNWAFHSCPIQYRKLRNKVIPEIKTAKASYHPNKIHQLKLTNNRQWYDKIRALCGLRKHYPLLTCTSHFPTDAAAYKINSHFATICQTFPSIHSSPLPSFLPTPFPPPTVQVYKRILKLKPRSTTPTDLPIKIYKEFAPELAAPLCSIINASLFQ
ncbi:hypothetical protein E2C01_072121 [Portunus trituberculatus]|uniref:RNA-directed DNA polymerase from mobile element jockey n=1 Tax=Portunus trituberculatus TaxID=210409 RepID=A0A5B7I1T3_PORTR|nr:hypothetical protein [Portunus trituberculatus]